MRRSYLLALATSALLASGCKEGTGTTGGGGSGGGAPDPGKPLDVPVGASPVYVDLDQPAIVTATDAWELEFDGVDVFTNGGVSGTGMGRAFGPLDAASMDTDTVPSDVPFLVDDYTGGPFIDWFDYDNQNHVLYGRFHVYGVRRGTELYKVQVLGFYGEQAGAPVAALYEVRYAPVTSTGVGATVSLTNVDGTAGGSNPDPSVPSACLRLSTGTLVNHTPAEASTASDWDLCFRRAEISVNGEDGGPGGVSAVDLLGDQTANETLTEVEMRTKDSELAAFDAVDYAALTKPALAWRGDGKRSAFTDKWIVLGSNPLAPADATWLVAGSDGATPFFVKFDGFDGATASSVGTVHMRVKAIKGSLP